MSADATISLDTRDLNKALRGLAIATGKDADTIVMRESRLFAEKAMKLTPPRTLAQGRKAVARDIKKIIAGASESLIRHAIQENDGSGDNIKVYSGDTEQPSIDWRRAQLTDEGLKSWHNSQRDRRGRIQSRARARGSGRWLENKRIVVPERVRSDYIKRKQKNVGRLKAGWVPSVNKFHGKAAGWIRKHNPKGSAEIRGMRTNEVTAIMTNNATGAGSLDRFMRDVLRIRLSAIMRDLRLIQSGYAKDFARNMRIQTRARRAR